MFVRKKPNKSGKISVQVIDKSHGKYTVIKTIGCSSIPNEIAELISKGENWIQSRKGLMEIPFNRE